MAKILIVASPYYWEITEALVKDAKTELTKHGHQLDVVDVPGALEIPQAIYHKRTHYDGFVALGCVIRGETSHYDVVCSAAMHGLMSLSMDHGIIIGNGLLTVENVAQAERRAGLGESPKGNKGADAAHACMQLLAVKEAV